MACWLLGFLGFSVCRLVGFRLLIASCILFYHVTLSYMNIHIYIYIIIKVYHVLVYGTIIVSCEVSCILIYDVIC